MWILVMGDTFEML